MRFEVVDEEMVPGQILSGSETESVDLTFEDTVLVFMKAEAGVEEGHGVELEVAQGEDLLSVQSVELEAVETREVVNEAIVVSSVEATEAKDTTVGFVATKPQTLSAGGDGG